MSRTYFNFFFNELDHRWCPIAKREGVEVDPKNSNLLALLIPYSVGPPISTTHLLKVCPLELVRLSKEAIPRVPRSLPRVGMARKSSKIPAGKFGES